LIAIAKIWREPKFKNFEVATRKHFGETMQTYDSIGLAGASVGVVNLDGKQLKWVPRHSADASPETILMENVLRAAWAPVGKICHLRLFTKSGEKFRFDGFRKADIDTLKTFFEGKVNFFLSFFFFFFFFNRTLVVCRADATSRCCVVFVVSTLS
jgi:hypothetical protein